MIFRELNLDTVPEHAITSRLSGGTERGQDATT